VKTLSVLSTLAMKMAFFYGKIEGINDLVAYKAESVTELRKSFTEAVVDNLKI
jgi:hypothetical protein